MTYPGLDTVNATTDLSNLLLYANAVTDNVFMKLILGAFWAIIFITTIMSSIRFNGVAKPEIAFLVASLASVGFSVIMASKNGLLEPYWTLVMIALSGIGIAWVAFTAEP